MGYRRLPKGYRGSAELAGFAGTQFGDGGLRPLTKLLRLLLSHISLIRAILPWHLYPLYLVYRQVSVMTLMAAMALTRPPGALDATMSMAVKRFERRTRERKSLGALGQSSEHELRNKMLNVNVEIQTRLNPMNPFAIPFATPIVHIVYI